MTADHLPPTVGLRIDPAEIRRALALSDADGVREAAHVTGYGHATIERWRRWQRNAAETGYEWPSDLDAARYKANTARRARARRYKPYRHSGKYRRVDATGARRRLEALAAIGWTRKLIAEVAGIPYATIEHLDTETLHDTTAEAVRRAYDRLSMTPGPSSRVRALALRRGWPPPLAYDDIDNPNERPKGLAA